MTYRVSCGPGHVGWFLVESVSGLHCCTACLRPLDPRPLPGEIRYYCGCGCYGHLCRECYYKIDYYFGSAYRCFNCTRPQGEL